jgi:hypothetical protein
MPAIGTRQIALGNSRFGVPVLGVLIRLRRRVLEDEWRRGASEHGGGGGAWCCCADGVRSVLRNDMKWSEEQNR